MVSKYTPVFPTGSIYYYDFIFPRLMASKRWQQRRSQASRSSLPLERREHYAHTTCHFKAALASLRVKCHAPYSVECYHVTQFVFWGLARKYAVITGPVCTSVTTASCADDCFHLLQGGSNGAADWPGKFKHLLPSGVAPGNEHRPVQSMLPMFLCKWITFLYSDQLTCSQTFKLSSLFCFFHSRHSDLLRCRNHRTINKNNALVFFNFPSQPWK